MKEELYQLFTSIEKLQKKFSHHKKKFTLDGKLVGDIGEVLVAEHYGITLYGDNVAVYDGYVTSDANKHVHVGFPFLVQVKSIQYNT